MFCAILFVCVRASQYTQVGFTAVLSIIPLTLQAEVDWGTSQPPLSHISQIKKVCGGAFTGAMPRPNILGYHCVVYQTAQRETIYTFLSGSHKRWFQRGQFIHPFHSLFRQYYGEGERGNVGCDPTCKRDSGKCLT